MSEPEESFEGASLVQPLRLETSTKAKGFKTMSEKAESSQPLRQEDEQVAWKKSVDELVAEIKALRELHVSKTTADPNTLREVKVDELFQRVEAAQPFLKVIECEQRLVGLKHKMLDHKQTLKGEIRQGLLGRLFHPLEELYHMNRRMPRNFDGFLPFHQRRELLQIYDLPLEDCQEEVKGEWWTALNEAKAAIHDLDSELSKLLSGNVKKLSLKLEQESRPSVLEGLHRVYQLQEKVLTWIQEVLKHRLTGVADKQIHSEKVMKLLQEAKRKISILLSTSSTPTSAVLYDLMETSPRVLKMLMERLENVLRDDMTFFLATDDADPAEYLRKIEEVNQCIDEIDAELTRDKTAVVTSEHKATRSASDVKTNLQKKSFSELLPAQTSLSKPKQHNQFTPTTAKLAINEWGSELLKMLREWLWDNGNATKFYSICLRHKTHQDNLVDVMMLILRGQMSSFSIKEFIERLLRKILELALTPVPFSLQRYLSEFIESESIQWTEISRVAEMLAMCPPINEALRDFLWMMAGKKEDVEGKQLEELSPKDQSHSGKPTAKDVKIVVNESEDKLAVNPKPKRDGVDKGRATCLKKGTTIGELRKSSTKITTRLSQLLRSNGVPHFQVLKDPRGEKKIDVFGVDVEMHQEELSSVASKDGFAVHTENIPMVLGPNGLPLLSNWIDSCAGIIRDPQYSINLHHRPIVTVNAIMQGAMTGRRRDTEEYFALTTAHAVLDDTRRQRLNGSTADFKDVVDEVALEWLDNDNYYMAVKGGNDVDIKPPPRWLYKYWVQEGNDSEWCAYQDIAFLNLVDTQVFTDGLIDSGNKSIDGAAPSVLTVEDAFIHPILSVESAENLIGKKIICKELPGVLVDSMEFLSEDEQREGFIMGIHLEFVFDDPDRRLIPGDCGSLVYLAEKKDGKLPIIGMFFGQLIRKKQVHCALILDWNIKLAMQTQELKLKDIKLAGHSPDVLLGEALNEDLPLPLPASGIDDPFLAPVDSTLGNDDHTLGSDEHTLGSGGHTLGSVDHTLASDDHTLGSDEHTLGSGGHTLGSVDHTLASGVQIWKEEDGAVVRKATKVDGNHEDKSCTPRDENISMATSCVELAFISAYQVQKPLSRDEQANPEFQTRNAKQPNKKSANNNHKFPRQKAE